LRCFACGIGVLAERAIGVIGSSVRSASSAGATPSFWSRDFGVSSRPAFDAVHLDTTRALATLAVGRRREHTGEPETHFTGM
jgi:hypothetical protein